MRNEGDRREGGVVMVMCGIWYMVMAVLKYRYVAMSKHQIGNVS